MGNYEKARRVSRVGTWGSGLSPLPTVLPKVPEANHFTFHTQPSQSTKWGRTYLSVALL